MPRNAETRQGTINIVFKLKIKIKDIDRGLCRSIEELAFIMYIIYNI